MTPSSSKASRRLEEQLSPEILEALGGGNQVIKKQVTKSNQMVSMVS